MKNPHLVIDIVGPSCSGKSTVAKYLTHDLAML